MYAFLSDKGMNEYDNVAIVITDQSIWYCDEMQATASISVQYYDSNGMEWDKESKSSKKHCESKKPTPRRFWCTVELVLLWENKKFETLHNCCHFNNIVVVVRCESDFTLDIVRIIVQDSVYWTLWSIRLTFTPRPSHYFHQNRCCVGSFSILYHRKKG